MIDGDSVMGHAGLEKKALQISTGGDDIVEKAQSALLCIFR